MPRAVIIIGRFNPPTIGHLAILDKARQIIRKNRSKLHHNPVIAIIEAKKKDALRNPLTSEQRKKFMMASGK